MMQAREVAAPRALLAREHDAQNNNDDAQIMSLNAQLVKAKSDADKFRTQLWAERSKHNHELESLKEKYETELRCKDDQLEETRQIVKTLQFALLDVSNASKAKIEQELKRAKDLNRAVERECLTYNQHLEVVEARLRARAESRLRRTRSEENIRQEVPEKSCSIM